jgi:diguanylate cyclase (GGDEF)-like protein
MVLLPPPPALSPPHDATGPALWRRQLLAALAWELGGVVFMLLLVALGHAPLAAVLVWAPLSLLMSGGTLLALSLGWTHHLRDPALTVQQVAWSVGSAVACYGLAGPMRALTIPLTCLALLFSIFSLGAEMVRWMVRYAIGLYGAVMMVMAVAQPDRYPPLEEATSFLVLLVVLPGFAVLGARWSRVRQQLRQQRGELHAALARLADAAERDALTGLFNRRRLTQSLQDRCAQSARGGSFHVVLLDIDHFKSINDSHGHGVGDLVLQGFAQRLATLVRDTDLAGRWGGEEFLLLLPHDRTDEAVQAAERLRQELATVTVALPGGAPLSVTVSIGVARFEPTDTPEAVVARADRALYAAKAQGRDQVVAH